MKLTPKSWLLAGVAVVLALLNLIGEAAPTASTLPSLPSFAVNEVTRLTVSTIVEKMEISRVGPPGTTPEDPDSRWELVSPLQFPADAAQVRALLRTFGPGVNMETYVDEGHLEDYGVDDQSGKLLEIFTQGSTPVVSVVVGKTAAGGTTFVRISGGQKVYRADVGGRARLDHPAADWRDKSVLDLDRGRLSAFTLQRGAERLEFVRGPSAGKDKENKPLPGPWRLNGAAVPVDEDVAETLARALTRLRATEVHAPDFPADLEHPAVVATLTMDDGATHRVVVGGSGVSSAVCVRVDDRPEVFEVNPQLRWQLTAPVETMRDRSLLRFERQDLESVTLAEGGLTVVITQSADGATWSITQPPNMDADQRQVLFTVNTLATLRAYDVAPDDAFTPAGSRFTLRFRDGHTETVDVGQAESVGDRTTLRRVRVSGREGVYRMKAANLAELRKAFGRG